MWAQGQRAGVGVRPRGWGRGGRFRATAGVTRCCLSGGSVGSLAEGSHGPPQGCMGHSDERGVNHLMASCVSWAVRRRQCLQSDDYGLCALGCMELWEETKTTPRDHLPEGRQHGYSELLWQEGRPTRPGGTAPRDQGVSGVSHGGCSSLARCGAASGEGQTGFSLRDPKLEAGTIVRAADQVLTVWARCRGGCGWVRALL